MAEEQTIVGTIQRVEEKHLVRKSDNQPFTLYKFHTLPLGELSSTKRDLFNQASALVGHNVVLYYVEKQNDNGYTNRYLNQIEITAQQPLLNEPTHVPPQGWEQAAKDIAAAQQPLQNASIGRDEAIWRQTATKTAASFNNKDVAEYWGRVAMLLDFYRTGIIPTVAAEPSPFIPPDDLPQDRIEITDADIPF